MTESLYSRYSLHLFKEPEDVFLGFLESLTKYPEAVRIYRNHDASALQFDVNMDELTLTVSTLDSELDVYTELSIKGSLRYQHYLDKRMNSSRTDKNPSVTYWCDCGAKDTCMHARALIALYGSVIYREFAPKIFKWKNWINSLPKNEAKKVQRSFIELKMTKSKQEYSIKSSFTGNFFSYSQMNESEQGICRLLGERTKLSGKQGAVILNYLAAAEAGITYRSEYLNNDDERDVDVVFQWSERSGELTLKAKLPSKIEIIPTEPPFYIDQENGKYGLARLKQGVSETLKMMKTLGSIPEQEAREFSLALIKSGVWIPLPDSSINIINEKVRPNVRVSFSGSSGTKVKPRVKLHVDRNTLLPNVGNGIVQTAENTFTRYSEDSEFVTNLIERLRPLGIEDNANAHSLKKESDESLSASQLAALQAEMEALEKESGGSLHVEVDDRYPILVHEYDGDLEIDTSLDTESNLINFTPGLLIKGKRVNLLKPVLSLLDSLEDDEDFSAFLKRLPLNIYLDIDDITALQIPSSVVKPLLQFIHDYSVTRTSLRVTRFDADALFNLQEGLGSQVNKFYVDPRVLQSKGFFDTLRNNQPIPAVALPEQFIGHLEPYQKIGVDWLCYLATYGFGGILADDMGAGKTRQLIGYLSVRNRIIPKESKPHFLVICPVNPTQDWMDELKATCPTLDAYLLHGIGRAQSILDIEQHELIITTYGTFANDEFLRTDVQWDTVILDEVQDANNAQSNIFDLLAGLKTRCMFASSGTPMENTLEELRAVMDLVNRGYLGNRSQFNRIYTKPIVEDGCRETLQKLRRKIGPFILRRKDGDKGVHFNVPENTTETIYFDLEGAHLEHYEKVRVAGHTEVLRKLKQSGLLKGTINTLPSLTEMRLICCDLSLANEYVEGTAFTNNKLEYLVNELKELSSLKKKALVFTYFSGSMHVISRALAQHDIGHVCIDGTDTKKSRDRKKDEFREHKTDHIIATLKAMNSGANLQNAHEVFIFDPWYNPHKELQAIKRAHRKGLQHELRTRRLLFNNTVEIGVVAIRERKKALFDAVLEEDINYIVTGGITKEDIELIFKSPSVA